MFLPPHPWEDLEGIPSHGTGIKLEGMERAALNAVAGKLKIKSPASQPLKELEDGVLRAHARKREEYKENVKHLRTMVVKLERTKEGRDVLQHRIRLSQIAHLRMRGISEQNYRHPSDASQIDWEQVHVHFKALCHAEGLGLEASNFSHGGGTLAKRLHGICSQ